MTLVCISARNVRDIDPYGTARLTVTLDMTDAQIFEAIDSLLDARTDTQRATWLQQLNEMEAQKR